MHAHDQTAAAAAAFDLTAAAMERGLLAPLSPNEAVALKRISQGATEVDDAHIQRLKTLALVDQGPSGHQLTELGRRRLVMLESR